MNSDLRVVGAGIGGLSLALAHSRPPRGLGRAERRLVIQEKTPVLSEVGAGLQLGPNAVRHLFSWGLASELRSVAFEPQRLIIHSLLNGEILAQLPLAEQGRILNQYGAPYLTLRRADLQQILLRAVNKTGATDLQLNQAWQPEANAGSCVIGADGLWSSVRASVWPEAQAPKATGHVAWRALVSQKALPPAWRSDSVRVWLGPRCHVVAYPVAAGEQLNIVAIANQKELQAAASTTATWDQDADLNGVRTFLLPKTPAALRSLLEAVPAWRQWPLFDRPPVRSAADMVRGGVALLGDAAHPMRPYFAQGAAMAIEDAAELAAALSECPVELALSRYAQRRWERCARVQSASERNGRTFHASGPFGWVQKARDASLRLFGPQLMDPTWLYGGGPGLLQSPPLN